MPDTKLSGLSAASKVFQASLAYVVQAGSSLKATISQLLVAGAPDAAADTQAGNPITLQASAATAGTTNAGAAAGGDASVVAGAAARLTSGNANGGNVVLTPGAGIGTGVTGAVNCGGAVRGIAGSLSVPSFAFTGETNTGIFNRSAGYVTIVGQGTLRGEFNASALDLRSALAIGWSTAPESVASDAFISRAAAAVIRTTNASGASPTWLQNTAGRSRVTTSNVTNATITPAAITGLSATVIAGRKYAGTLVLYYTAATAADGLRLDFDGGTATMTSFVAQGYLSDDNGFQAIARTTAIATDTTNTTVTGSALVVVKFAFVVNAAGTFIPRFAKEADAAGATGTVLVDSHMLIEDLP